MSQFFPYGWIRLHGDELKTIRARLLAAEQGANLTRMLPVQVDHSYKQEKRVKDVKEHLRPLQITATALDEFNCAEEGADHDKETDDV